MRRKYREGPWEDLKEVLLDDKRRNPGGVPYCLGCRHETPGYFYLGAILSRTPYRETFQATNEGFYYRHEVLALQLRACQPAHPSACCATHLQSPLGAVPWKPA